MSSAQLMQFFLCGRLSQIVATPPSTSYCRTSSVSW